MFSGLCYYDYEYHCSKHRSYGYYYASHRLMCNATRALIPDESVGGHAAEQNQTNATINLPKLDLRIIIKLQFSYKMIAIHIL